MPVCRYFSGPGGCKRGESCHFQHDSQSVTTPSPVENLTYATRRLDLDWRTGPNTPQTPVESSSLVVCRFYVSGSCKNGNDCRFFHPPDRTNDGHSVSEKVVSTSDAEPTQPQPEQSQRTVDAKTRELGGALVTFGHGAIVCNIETAVTERARLQIFNVTCSWYQPSKTATLVFNSSEVMNEVSKQLEHARLDGRKLQCRTTVNKKTRPWDCMIKIGNLATSTSEKALRSACGVKRPHTINWGTANYSASQSDIGRIVHKLLTSKVTVKTWTLPESQSGQTCKANATLETMADVTKAIAEFDGYKLPQLAGSSINLSYVAKAKFVTLTAIYKAVSSEIEAEVSSPGGSLNVKAYPPSGLFTTLHVISETLKGLARGKGAINKILQGHTARSGE